MTLAYAVTSDDLPAVMADLGRRARVAQRLVQNVSPDQRTKALFAIAQALTDHGHAILEANEADMAAARAKGLDAAMLDRLELTPKRLAGMIQGVRDIAELPDPVGAVIESWERPNGLKFQRVRTPLGVIGIIFESRPNVAADAGALCLRAGNAAILRGGSESANSVREIGHAIREGLLAAALPEDTIQIIPTQDRAAVGLLLSGLEGCVDVIVPRGGKGLVARVQTDARVPVFAHLEGLCHTYIHAAADLNMAVDVVLNAKMRRTGVCGATETLLVDAAIAASHLPPIAAALSAAGCALRGDDRARAIVPMETATEDDWRTEYLAPILSVRIVDGLDDAIAHITKYSSAHTEAIITDDAAAAETFLARVDSAIVLWNASTQFADGGEFGFGAEIGIATGRMHARGPIGANELTTFKSLVRGAGTLRP